MKRQALSAVLVLTFLLFMTSCVKEGWNMEIQDIDHYEPKANAKDSLRNVRDWNKQYNIENEENTNGS